jgi:acyl-coenzyme A synthetase/AMP-(fatty) acid ligase
VLIHEHALWALIEARATASPESLFLVDELGREVTFGEYRAQVEAVAAGLHDMGVGAGTMVSWQLPTWVESVVLVGALSRLGTVQNPMLPIYRSREVGFISQQLSPSLLVCPGMWRGFDYAEQARAWANTEVLVCDRDHGLPNGDPATLPPAEPDAHRFGWVFYTSGTTADPKGARHSDFTVGAPGRAMVHWFGMQDDDRCGLVFPFTHIGGIQFVFAALYAGMALVLVEAFDDDGIDFLSRRQITFTGAGTPFYLKYLERQRAQPDRPLFPHIRGFAGGGQTKPPHLHHEMLESFGAPILSGWGLTEFANIAMNDHHDSDHHKARTEGFANFGVELKAVLADGSEAPPGTEGELRAKGFHMHLGYVDEALNETAFDDDGYFITGDLGIIDTEGYVEITGRAKDVIIRKGENVSAKEVEDALYTHPAVADVAVVGLPDPERGERVCAIVVPSPEAAPPSLDELTDHLINIGLMRQKHPEQLETAEILPRNPAGKVLKEELRKRFSSPT